MLLESDGTEIDCHLGYQSPPEGFMEKIEKSLRGEETVRSLSDELARNPNNIEAALNLGRKMELLNRAGRAADLFRKVISIDPAGSKGVTYFQGEPVGFTAYAEFGLATISLFSDPPDPGPLRAYVYKYPVGPLVRRAYDILDINFYGRGRNAGEFYEEYASRFPNDQKIFRTWLRFILVDPQKLGEALDGALKAVSLSEHIPDVASEAWATLARVRLARGEKSEAAVAAEQAALASEQNPLQLVSAAELLVAAGATGRALDFYGKSFAKNHSQNAGILIAYAVFWARRTENAASALDAAKLAIKLEPGSYSVWKAMSAFRFDRAEYNEALKAAEKALALAPLGKPEIKNDLLRNLAKIKSTISDLKKRTKSVSGVAISPLVQGSFI